MDTEEITCPKCGHKLTENAASVGLDEQPTSPTNKSQLGALVALGGILGIAGIAIAVSSSQPAAEEIQNASADVVADVIAEAEAKAEAATKEGTTEAVGEIEIVSLCDFALKEALASEPDLDYRWNYSVLPRNERQVVRSFKAQNGFGATFRHRYFCTYDAGGDRIKKLTVEGPGGSHKII